MHAGLVQVRDRSGATISTEWEIWRNQPNDRESGRGVSSCCLSRACLGHSFWTWCRMYTVMPNSSQLQRFRVDLSQFKILLCCYGCEHTRIFELNWDASLYECSASVSCVRMPQVWNENASNAIPMGLCFRSAPECRHQSALINWLTTRRVVKPFMCKTLRVYN